MIFPNKIVRVDRSILWRATNIINAGDATAVVNMYEQVSQYFDDIEQFVLALDLLYILGKIELDEGTGEVVYVG